MTAQQAFRNTIIVLATIAAAYAIYRSLQILVALLVSVIIASAVRPAVLWLSRHHIPHGLAILAVYGGLGFWLVLLSAIVVPPITGQLTDYISNDQRLAARIIDTQSWIESHVSNLTGTQVKFFDPDQIKTVVSTTVQQIIKALPSIAGEFGNFLADFILVVVMGIYWLTERDQAVDFMLRLFPLGRRATMNTIIRETELSLSAYLRGVVLVAVFVGITNFIILSILRVQDALTLGFIMGITTLLPIVGGYIGAGLSTLIALLTSPLNALLAFGSFVAVQQVENHYLTPRVMSYSVGLKPIIIIISLFVGYELDGVIGALIAVPVAGTINVILRHLVIDPRMDETTPQIVEGGILLAPRDQMPTTDAAAGVR